MSELLPDDSVPESGRTAPSVDQQDLFSSAPSQNFSSAPAQPFNPLANDPASAGRGSDGAAFLDRNEISNTGLYSARYGAKYCGQSKKPLQVTWKRSEVVYFDLTEEEMKEVTLGKLLSTARIKCELKLEDVVALTKIRSEFVQALEEDDFDALPPGVFGSAYLRTLSDLYNVDDDGKKLLKAKFALLASQDQSNKGLSQSAADKLEQTASVNVDELKKMKRVFIFSIMVMAVLCIIVGCVAASCGRSSADFSEAEKYDAEENLLIMEQPDTDALTAPEIPELSVLKISPVPALSE